MEILAVIGIIVGLVILYFCLGIALRFLWGWWIIIIAMPICVYIGVVFGWLGAIIGVIGFCFAVYANNEWHDASLCMKVGDKIDRAFYFKDT